MANRPVYCQEPAVRTHIGNLPLAPGVSVESAIEAAAMEMDGLLGDRYTVPILVSPNIAEQKVTAYWLQSANAMLCAGRLLLSAASDDSHEESNNYGRYLVTTAMAQIKLVVDGKRNLPGAIETPEEASSNAGPIIYNGDAYSQVDLYYDNFVPDGFAPGRTPRATGTTWPR